MLNRQLIVKMISFRRSLLIGQLSPLVVFFKSYHVKKSPQSMKTIMGLLIDPVFCGSRLTVFIQITGQPEAEGAAKNQVEHGNFSFFIDFY
jgi:hypothetical protein